MANQDLGKVIPTYRDEYNATYSYEIFDIVTYQGSSYIAIASTVGNLPTNTMYFRTVALRGLKGDAFVYSDFTPGQLAALKGATGDKGDGLKILGSFPTVAALQAAYPDGSALSGGFMIQTEYYYWSANNSWESAGPLQGAKGDAFVYTDFTPAQLTALTGPKGDAFVYNDFTPEQLTAITGKTAFASAVSGGFTGSETDFNTSLGSIGNINEVLASVVGG